MLLLFVLVVVMPSRHMLVKSTLFTGGIGRDQRHRWRNVVFGCLIMVGGRVGGEVSGAASLGCGYQVKINHDFHT
jgi:hypothetical protein